MKQPITFIVATTQNDGVFANNFLRSPLFTPGHPHEIISLPGYRSAAAAYNAGIDKATNDLLVFIHQDVYLPQLWLDDLKSALAQLEQINTNWGVLGCYGVERDGKHRGHVYSSPQGIIGEALSAPVPVRTLDEIVLIFRKSSGLRFDEKLPHFHFYGADVCLEAASRGKSNYVLPAFCIHNTDHFLPLPKEFYVCYRYIKQKWSDSLPIHAPCISIERWNLNLFAAKAYEYRLMLTGKTKLGGYRASDIQQLWESIRDVIGRNRAGKPAPMAT